MDKIPTMLILRTLVILIDLQTAQSLEPKITGLSLSSNYSSQGDSSLLVATYSADNENNTGAVCGDGFTEKTAQLVCKHLGYDRSSARVWTSNLTSVIDAVVRNVSCKGGNWSGCTYNITSNLTCSSGAVYLKCVCPAGKRVAGTECVSCHKNTYSTRGSRECTKCPDGTHSRSGSSHCQSCDFGQEWKHKTCVDCPEGEYGDGMACHPCGPGFTSGTDGLCHRLGPARDHWTYILLGAAAGVLSSVTVALCALYANRKGDCSKCWESIQASARYKHLKELTDEQNASSSRQSSLIISDV